MSAKDLETSLGEAGEKVSQGRIRIDSARALQRLRDFRFADPAHWVLEVLRAAVLSNAKIVKVRTDADDVEISFDGRPFRPDLMKHLLEQALNGGPSPEEKRTRLLALGVAGALGAEAQFVKVASGGVSLTLSGDEVEVTEAPSKGTHLHLRKAFGWRVTAAFFRGAPEVRAIQERAIHFPGYLELNGKAVNARANHPGKRVLEGEGWRMEVWLPTGEPREFSNIELDVAGVVVAERAKVLPGLQLNAWLRAYELRRNASGSDVVDDDETLASALVALRKVSRELLEVHGPKLAEDEAWRGVFIHQLLETKTLDEQVKKLLHEVPLLPGPGGEWLTIAEVTEAARTNTCVYTAKRAWPKGSYPAGTVLLAGGQPFTTLLPPGKQVDVEALVKVKEQVAINRQRHEEMEIEPATLPSRSWIARAAIDATAVTGEVGFEASGNGAFVRVLHKGRLMESGELTALAPLRLRAVIDWNRTLADSFFSAQGSQKLLGLVLKYVENAAAKAICEGLPRPELLPHAFDLLTRIVVHRDGGRAEIPSALRTAPLFPCLGGPDVTLETLLAEPQWRFVNFRAPHGLLDGGRVLVLSPAQREVLKRLEPKRLEDVTTQLRDEEEIRKRLAGPKRTPVAEGALVKVKIEGEGLHGEVGVPRQATARLALTLLKSGLVLETTVLSARYHHAVAAVDCEALSPNARWSGATRDGAFKLVSAAVHDAQRRLGAELVKLPRQQWHLGADQFFIAFLKKELTPFDPDKLDEVTRAVASAPIFTGAHGPRSLLQVHEQVKRDGRFFVVASERPPTPPDFELLHEQPAIAAALGEALEKTPEDPSATLTTLDARRRLAALPKAEFKLPKGLSLECRLTEAGSTVLAGLRNGLGDQASGFVHLDERVYSVLLVPCALPLEVLIDAPGFEPNPFRELTGDQRLEVGRLVAKGMQAVIGRALERKNDADARRALLLALGHSLDHSLPEEDAERLRERALFPCTDGRLRSFKELDHDSPQYVMAAMEGELPNGRPIVIAAEPLMRLAMGRWPRAERVEDALAMQLTAVRQREAQAPVSEIVSSAESPWRQRVSERGLSGEVVVSRVGGGRLELFFQKKPLCVLEGVLPPPLVGAVDSPRLTPKPGFRGVVEDANLEEVITALTEAGARLALQLAEAARVPELDGVLVQLAFWVASTHAWKWKSRKKGKKKKGEVQPIKHPLLDAPLLRTSDLSPLSVQVLLAQHLEQGRVDVARHRGAFLESGRVAWWPREDEERWAVPLALTFNDVTADLQLAESIRQRPRFEQVRSPLGSEWREPVSGPALEGEVAIGPAPDGKLIIEVLHQRMLLETWSSEHPIGGVARVDSSALKPDEKWTAAKRDAAFKALVTSTEAALERLLVRRLADPQKAGFRSWAGAAVRWRSGQAGPLAALVPSLELFSDLNGRPMTIGAVFDLSTRKGRLPISRSLDAEGPPGVLLDTPETRALLTTLGLQVEDVSGELARAKDLQQALTARRLASLTWKGEWLVKVTLNTGVLEGELALNAKSEEGGVVLAREGIPVAPLEDTWPGVVGVVDVKELSVNDDWTTAQPTRVQRGLIRAQVEQLFTVLAQTADAFGARERELAATWALHFLMEGGLETPGQLDRLTGAAHALADAPLFLTVEGERVNLRAVAAEVNARGKVAVLARSVGVPEGASSCVLETSAWDAPWLIALDDLFGKSRIWRVTDLEEWRREVREADPQQGEPELEGLLFLRREVRLLRAGALGHLTPDDLEDVKLSRAGGGKALRYDKKRKLALIDPEHPDIKRTLKEARQRPERLWVLIAALFGLVNRELEHVTDAHEAQLLMALAGHLASNPKLLS